MLLDLDAAPPKLELEAPPLPAHRGQGGAFCTTRTLASVQREASDSTASLVDLATRCELDDRQDLTGRPAATMSRPKSKPSDLNLANMDQIEAPQKKKRAAIHWNDLKNLRFAGEGAHCTVHTAELDGKPVAVEILKQEQRSDPVAIHDLECEAELMAGMRHQHVMKLVGSGFADDMTFLVMERLQSTLSETLAKSSHAIFPGRAAKKQWPVSREPLARPHVEAYRRPRRGTFCRSTQAKSRLPRPRAAGSLAVAEQIARAMVYVHDEAYPEHVLLHRDLKPDNIG